jgi:hypothetical protein
VVIAGAALPSVTNAAVDQIAAPARPHQGRIGFPVPLQQVPVTPSATATAGSALLPASLFPRNSRIVFQPDVSNRAMDAAWNFDAAGEALMHRFPQDAFERQSGWMEQAFLQRGKRIVWFVIFDSRYGAFQDGHRGNVSAYSDLKLMLTKWWHARLATAQPEDILPGGVTGQTETRIIPKESDGPFVVTSAWWGDTDEIEAVAFGSHQLVTRTRLRALLAAQIQYATRLPDP